MGCARPLLGLAFAVLVAGCGDISTTRQEYRGEGKGFEKGKNKVVLTVGTQKSKHDDGFDTEYRHGAPYTVNVTAYAMHGSEQPFELRALSLEHQGESIVIRKASDEPLRAELRGAPNTAHYSARIKVALDDDLTFVEGSTLTVRAVVRPPYLAKPAPVQRDFVAHARTTSASRFEVIMAH